MVTTEPQKGEKNMPRPQTKEDLIKVSEENFASLNKLINELTEKEINTPFDFSDSPSKKEQHWARDKNVRDVLVHLYEWHLLGIKFIENNKETGKNIAFLPEPYTFKNYGLMNIEIWKKHQGTSLEETRTMVTESHNKLMDIVASLSNEELFTRGYFTWTGNKALGSYMASNLSSHYDWAIKKIKAHKKNCQK